jgi:pimeloyl-ACP methyl ester carboxylesterase
MQRSSNVVTTPLGDVEVETRGSGTPILILHGSPGGIDAARAMGRFLPENRFRIIVVSRPGYLGTPLDPADPSIDHEADLMTALLAELNADRVGVFAWSGGGPSAYRLAARHPERVTSLVQVAAVSSRWVAPPIPTSDRFMFGTNAGQWLIAMFARRWPSQIVNGALAGEGSVRGDELKALTASVMADPQQRSDVLTFAQTVGTNGPRQAGWQNDVANYGAIDSLELERVQCPVLLVHGDADTDASPDFSYTAHNTLADSQLVIMDRGTHLCFYAHPDAPAVQQQARDFLAR